MSLMLNQEVLKKAIYALETLSHNPEYAEVLMSKGLIRQVMTILQMSEEAKKKSVTASVISLLVFYSNKEKEWLHMCKPYLARILCSYLSHNNQVKLIIKLIAFSQIIFLFIRNINFL